MYPTEPNRSGGCDEWATKTREGDLTPDRGPSRWRRPRPWSAEHRFGCLGEGARRVQVECRGLGGAGSGPRSRGRRLVTERPANATVPGPRPSTRREATPAEARLSMRGAARSRRNFRGLATSAALAEKLPSGRNSRRPMDTNGGGRRPSPRRWPRSPPRAGERRSRRERPHAHAGSPPRFPCNPAPERERIAVDLWGRLCIIGRRFYARLR